MGLDNRIEALKSRHQQLESAIATESTRACPNEDQIHSLKKEKLKIKDELHALGTRH